MAHKLTLLTAPLAVLLIVASAILYWSSRASAEGPAGTTISSPPADSYACIVSQQEYDNCTSAGGTHRRRPGLPHLE